MLKTAVVGAQMLQGRELVRVLETRDCSVLPLATGPITKAEEEGDLVVFAPEPSLLEGLDVVILADALQRPSLLEGFTGRILDLREEPDPKLDPMPLTGTWPGGAKAFRGRPALEQVLALVPSLVEGCAEVAGTHLRSVACLGDRGLDGLLEQTVAVLNGREPETDKLGYRAAFEVVPQVPRGSLLEVRVPSFHGDLLILHLRSGGPIAMVRKEAPDGVRWVESPPSSREVAVSGELLAHLVLTGAGQSGLLTLGYDPILWGVLRPMLRLLGV